MTASARYPLYDREGQIVAWIDEHLRLRDTRGRFISEDYDTRRAYLTSCLVVRFGRAARRV